MPKEWLALLHLDQLMMEVWLPVAIWKVRLWTFKLRDWKIDMCVNKIKGNFGYFLMMEWHLRPFLLHNLFLDISCGRVNKRNPNLVRSIKTKNPLKILPTGLENLQLVTHLKEITFKDKIIRISFKNLNPSWIGHQRTVKEFLILAVDLEMWLMIYCSL